MVGGRAVERVGAARLAGDQGRGRERAGRRSGGDVHAASADARPRRPPRGRRCRSTARVRMPMSSLQSASGWPDGVECGHARRSLAHAQHVTRRGSRRARGRPARRPAPRTSARAGCPRSWARRTAPSAGAIAACVGTRNGRSPWTSDHCRNASPVAAAPTASPSGSPEVVSTSSTGRNAPPAARRTTRSACLRVRRLEPGDDRVAAVGHRGLDDAGLLPAGGDRRDRLRRAPAATGLAERGHQPFAFGRPRARPRRSVARRPPGSRRATAGPPPVLRPRGRRARPAAAARCRPRAWRARPGGPCARTHRRSSTSSGAVSIRPAEAEAGAASRTSAARRTRRYAMPRAR